MSDYRIQSYSKPCWNI